MAPSGGPSRDEGDPDPGAAAPARRRLWASRTPGRVVARFRDGRVLKGYASLDPGRPAFDLLPAEPPGAEPVAVPVADLKAVFFVRSFAGAPDHVEAPDLYGARPAGTRKVRVEFEDGEELVGYTRDDPARPPGFFVTPLDPGSNNLRVFVVAGAVRRVERRL